MNRRNKQRLRGFMFLPAGFVIGIIALIMLCMPDKYTRVKKTRKPTSLKSVSIARFGGKANQMQLTSNTVGT